VSLPGDIIDSLEIEINCINTYGVLYPNLVIRFNNNECTFISKEEMETDSFNEVILNVDLYRTNKVSEQINSLFITDTLPIYNSFERLKRKDHREVDYVPLDCLFIRFYRHNYFLLGCKRKEGIKNIIIGDINSFEEQILYDKEKVVYSNTFKMFMKNVYEIMDGMISTQSEIHNSDDEEMNTNDLELIIDSLDRL